MSVESKFVNQAPAAVAPSSGGDGGLFQITSSAAALAQQMIYALMGLYLKIIDLDQQQKQNMLEAQSNAAKAQADATRQAGIDQCIGLVVAGGLTIVGAGVSAVLSATQEKAEYKTAKEGAETAGANLTTLKGLSETPEANANVGMGQGNAPSEAQLNAAVTRMKEGRFDANASDHLKALRNRPDRANDLVEIKTELDRQVSLASTQQSNYLKEMSEISTRRTSVTGAVSTVSQGLSNVAQGGSSPFKAQEDAKAQLNQVTGSMAGSASQTFDGQMTKMYDQAVAALQTLQRLQSAGQTN